MSLSLTALPPYPDLANSPPPQPTPAVAGWEWQLLAAPVSTWTVPGGSPLAPSAAALSAPPYLEGPEAGGGV